MIARILELGLLAFVVVIVLFSFFCEPELAGRKKSRGH